MKAIGWQKWTPTLIAATTNPVLGIDAGVSGEYRVRDDGLVEAHFAIIFGSSGVSAGSGQWFLVLPWQVWQPYDNTYYHYVLGRATGLDNNTNTIKTFVIRATYKDSPNERPHNAVFDYSGGAGTSSATSALPWTWAAGDRLSGDLMYRGVGQ